MASLLSAHNRRRPERPAACRRWSSSNSGIDDGSATGEETAFCTASVDKEGSFSVEEQRAIKKAIEHNQKTHKWNQ